MEVNTEQIKLKQALCILKLETLNPKRPFAIPAETLEEIESLRAKSANRQNLDVDTFDSERFSVDPLYTMGAKFWNYYVTLNPATTHNMTTRLAFGLAGTNIDQNDGDQNDGSLITGTKFCEFLSGDTVEILNTYPEYVDIENSTPKRNKTPIRLKHLVNCFEFITGYLYDKGQILRIRDDSLTKEAFIHTSMGSNSEMHTTDVRVCDPTHPYGMARCSGVYYMKLRIGAFLLGEYYLNSRPGYRFRDISTLPREEQQAMLASMDAPETAYISLKGDVLEKAVECYWNMCLRQETRHSFMVNDRFEGDAFQQPLCSYLPDSDADETLLETETRVTFVPNSNTNADLPWMSSDSAGFSKFLRTRWKHNEPNLTLDALDFSALFEFMKTYLVHQTDKSATGTSTSTDTASVYDEFHPQRPLLVTSYTGKTGTSTYEKHQSLLWLLVEFGKLIRGYSVQKSVQLLLGENDNPRRPSKDVGVKGTSKDNLAMLSGGMVKLFSYSVGEATRVTPRENDVIAQYLAQYLVKSFLVIHMDHDSSVTPEYNPEATQPPQGLTVVNDYSGVFDLVTDKGGTAAARDNTDIYLVLTSKTLLDSIDDEVAEVKTLFRTRLIEAVITSMEYPANELSVDGEVKAVVITDDSGSSINPRGVYQFTTHQKFVEFATNVCPTPPSRHSVRINNPPSLQLLGLSGRVGEDIFRDVNRRGGSQSTVSFDTPTTFEQLDDSLICSIGLVILNNGNELYHDQIPTASCFEVYNATIVLLGFLIDLSNPTIHPDTAQTHGANAQITPHLVNRPLGLEPNCIADLDTVFDVLGLTRFYQLSPRIAAKDEVATRTDASHRSSFIDAVSGWTGLVYAQEMMTNANKYCLQKVLQVLLRELHDENRPFYSSPKEISVDIQDYLLLAIRDIWDGMLRLGGSNDPNETTISEWCRVADPRTNDPAYSGTTRLPIETCRVSLVTRDDLGMGTVGAEDAYDLDSLFDSLLTAKFSGRTKHCFVEHYLIANNVLAVPEDIDTNSRYIDSKENIRSKILAYNAGRSVDTDAGDEASDLGDIFDDLVTAKVGGRTRLDFAVHYGIHGNVVEKPVDLYTNESYALPERIESAIDAQRAGWFESVDSTVDGTTRQVGRNVFSDDCFNKLLTGGLYNYHDRGASKSELYKIIGMCSGWFYTEASVETTRATEVRSRDLDRYAYTKTKSFNFVQRMIQYLRFRPERLPERSIINMRLYQTVKKVHASAMFTRELEFRPVDIVCSVDSEKFFLPRKDNWTAQSPAQLGAELEKLSRGDASVFDPTNTFAEISEDTVLEYDLFIKFRIDIMTPAGTDYDSPGHRYFFDGSSKWDVFSVGDTVLPHAPTEKKGTDMYIRTGESKSRYDEAFGDVRYNGINWAQMFRSFSSVESISPTVVPDDADYADGSYALLSASVKKDSFASGYSKLDFDANGLFMPHVNPKTNWITWKGGEKNSLGGGNDLKHFDLSNKRFLTKQIELAYASRKHLSVIATTSSIARRGVIETSLMYFKPVFELDKLPGYSNSRYPDDVDTRARYKKYARSVDMVVHVSSAWALQETKNNVLDVVLELSIPLSYWDEANNRTSRNNGRGARADVSNVVSKHSLDTFSKVRLYKPRKPREPRVDSANTGAAVKRRWCPICTS